MLKFGFFDSIEGDRKYNSRDVSTLFDGIITNGIYAQIGNKLSVNPKKVIESSDDNMTVTVDTGQAWLSHTKVINTTKLEFVLTPAIGQTRYDALIIEIDERTRDGRIFLKEGAKTYNNLNSSLIPGDDSKEFDLIDGELINNEFVHQYLLAVIKIERGSGKITDANIASKIGFDIPYGIPYVTCPLDSFPADETLKQWVAQWSEFYKEVGKSFSSFITTSAEEFMTAQSNREEDYNAFKLLATNWLNSSQSDWNTWFIEVQEEWDTWFNSVKEDIENITESAINEHNESDTAHNDIRSLVSNLTEKLNMIADSDDESLDQLSELVAYIKNNRDLITSITTGKVNITDIIDNLDSEYTDKPLSANQGRELKVSIGSLNNKLTTSYALKSSVEDLKKFVSDGKKSVADAITEMGVETAADASFATMAENIGEITTGSDMVLQQSITVKSTTEQQTVTPDDEYDGFMEVIVNPISLQEKNIIPSFKYNNVRDYTYYTPDNNKDGFSKIGVRDVTLQSNKEISPTTEDQYVYPDTGYDAFSNIIVKANQQLNNGALQWEKLPDPYSYGFVQNGDRWIATRNTTGFGAQSSWKVEVSEPITAYIGYRTASNGFLYITFENASGETITLVNGKNGLMTSESILTVNLTPGVNYIRATYNNSINGTNNYGEMCYLILPPIGEEPGQYKFHSSSITPQTYSQTVYPATGYDGLYAVTVSAVSSSGSSSSTKEKTGSVTMGSTGSTNSISIGFTPKILVFYNSSILIVYDSNISTSTFLYCRLDSATSGVSISIGSSANNAFIQSIGSTTNIKAGISAQANKTYSWHAMG